MNSFDPDAKLCPLCSLHFRVQSIRTLLQLDPRNQYSAKPL